jgi:hypothetical protein
LSGDDPPPEGYLKGAGLNTAATKSKSVFEEFFRKLARRNSAKLELVIF